MQASVIKGVRLLSLDGGGIRGLSTLYMLKTLMYRIQRVQGLEEMPLPCDYFDLIGGTSTGGLIAILIGRLRMSVDDAIACYVEFSKKVFGKTKSTWGEGRYSATIFEDVVKTLVRKRTGDTETPLLDDGALGRVCKIFVCARRVHAIDYGIAELFRSYQSTNPAVACTVWQAARATSAAPTFFKRVAIGPVQEQFIDGGMGVNNPAKQVLAEADAVFPNQQIACLISIGTGWTGTAELPKPGFLERNTIPVGVIKVLKALATDSEQTAQEMQLKFAKQPKIYFRFNVDHGLETVGLDDWRQMGKVASLTRSYADKHETRALLDDAVTVVLNPKQRATPTGVRINTCPPASRIFQGRQEILAKMQQFFSRNPGKQLIYVLHGLGGTGKTQTALKFIQDSDANFTNIFLVDASSIETIKIGLQNIAQSGAVGDSVEDALIWFKGQHDNWLLCFDNADDPDISLNDFIPQCNHGNILVTSRNPQLAVYGASSSVSDMEEPDAVTLLLRSASRENSAENVKVAAVIAKALYYLPLAIVQAGAFISESEDLEGYLALYQSNRKVLLSRKAGQTHDHYAWTVYTTWQISFERLSETAGTFLQLCSFLHYTGISENMFSYACGYEYPAIGPSKEDLKESLEFLAKFQGWAGKWDSLHFQEVINEIKSYSLINFDDKARTFSIHPLVHEWIRTTLAEEENSCQSKISCIIGMSITVPSHMDIQLLCLKYLPHLALLRFVNTDGSRDLRMAFWRVYYWSAQIKVAQTLAEQVVEKWTPLLGQEHPEVWQAMEKLATSFEDLGEFQKAAELETTVLEKRTKHFGEDHPDVWQAMQNLAVTYHGLGEFQKAAELEVTVLEKRTKHFGEGHPEVWQAIGNLAGTYHRLGELQKAVELQATVLEKRTKHLGEDHPDVWQAMENLAATYHRLGEFRKAAELQTTVLKKRTEDFGEDHPDVWQAMANLAVTYRDLGEFQKAAGLQATVLEKRTNHSGGDHPDVWQVMANQAATYRDLGELQKAPELQATVLDKRTKHFGEDHPDVWQVMANLAVTYHGLGELQKAVELQATVLDKCTKHFGEDHPDVWQAMANLAAMYYGLGEFQKAAELQVTVLEKRTTHFGEDHPDVWRAMANLAATYTDLGEFQKAAELQATVLQKRTKHFGKDHPDVWRSMANQAATYRELGEFQKAAELQVTVLEMCTKHFGEDHPDVWQAMENLAATYHRLCEFRKAAELQTTVLEKRTPHFGEDHPDVWQGMANLATTYHKLGELRKAAELQVPVLEKCTKHLGEDHPDVWQAMANLAATYHRLGELQRAVELEVMVVEKRRKHLGEDHPHTDLAIRNLAITTRALEQDGAFASV
ncbi:hypothetical protein C8R46DRAFT_1360542 [Mycena filopes]|nr:hypothetical protein C8R46DRAFT_1360542 [Mycena filopes]